MSLSGFNFSLDELTSAEQDSTNPYLADPAKGLKLITRLIGQPPAQTSAEQATKLARLHQLIHQNYVSLSARDDYPAEAQAFQDLLDLEESLSDLTQFPDLANKTIVGVGGGFSAGKSRFLNTLVGEALLPESLEPTTAIPSFLTGGQPSIVALNTFHHPVDIDADALLAITHAFRKHYLQTLGEEVGFAHVLKLVMIHRPGFIWKNLAFLDTPGYSKAENGNAGLTDEKIALKQLGEADHLIWLLNAKNGSIRQDDLDFLRTLNHPQPIFFVVTQGDLVGNSRIHAILASTAQAIKEAGLPCAGLMAWAAPMSASQGEKMAGDDVLAWLNQLNGSPKYTTKRRICARILDNHILHNQNALVNNRALLGALNDVMLMAANLPDNRRTVLTDQISKLRNDQQRLTELVEAFTKIKNDMLACISEIVGKLALDAEIKREHHLILNCKSDTFKRALQLNEHLGVQITAVRSEIKRVLVSVGDNLGEVAISFSTLRNELKLDPLSLAKGYLLAAEVRALDKTSVTLAITNPNSTK